MSLNLNLETIKYDNHSNYFPASYSGNYLFNCKIHCRSLKILIAILMLVTCSAFAGTCFENVYFDDNNVKHKVLVDRDGRYYVYKGDKLRIDGISEGSPAVEWNGHGYVTEAGTYVDSPATCRPVAMNVVVLAAPELACRSEPSYGRPFYGLVESYDRGVLRRAWYNGVPVARGKYGYSQSGLRSNQSYSNQNYSAGGRGVTVGYIGGKK